MTDIGEHDDAYYQWGISGNPENDAGGIRSKNGDLVKIFDYQDNWKPTSDVQKVKHFEFLLHFYYIPVKGACYSPIPFAQLLETNIKSQCYPSSGL